MSDSTAHLVPFGRYLLERRLAVGGMAEVFLGRLPGPQAFTKRVVVKRLLRHLADDHDAVTSFLDEAKLAARFTHPNLIQVFELAQIDGQYCIVMEYLEGLDLAQLLEACASSENRVPAPIAALLVARSAEALDYVHRLTSDDGSPLAVVHADISPGNIVLTRQGEVKVVDFGVAKHAGARTAVIRGKESYMAPEQLAGAAFDARADVFALGVVLYELLAASPLMAQRPDPSTLAAHIETKVSSLAVDARLNEIVRDALRVDPNQRIQSAAGLQRSLEAYLAGVTRPLASDVAAFAQTLPRALSDGPTPVRTLARDATRVVHGKYTDPRVPMRPETLALLADTPPSASTRRNNAWLFVVAALVITAGSIAVLVRHRDRTPPVDSVTRVETPAASVRGPAPVVETAHGPDPAASELPSAPPKSPPPSPQLPASKSRPPTKAPAQRPQKSTEAPVAVSAPPVSAPIEAPAPVAGNGRVAFIVDPWAQVYLGDRHLGTTPMAPIVLQAGRYEFRLVSPDTGREKTVGVNVAADKTSKVVETLR